MATTFKPAAIKPLKDQIAEAVQSSTVPISQLLRLMRALDSEPEPSAETLRHQLRARIGAPLQV